MERPKHQLTIILLLLNLLFKGSLAFTAPGDRISSSSSQTQALTNNISSGFQQQIYQAYISGKMDNWKTTIDTMEKQKKDESGFLMELINYQYGYVAWCLGAGIKKEAGKYLLLLEENLGNFKKAAGETAEFHAYTAAVYGFKIGLNAWRAPFFGPRSMEHAEKAIKLDSTSFQANMELGNIWNHMPGIFGGSEEKALSYYSKALEIIEKEPAEMRKNNWSYLNLLAIIGQIYQGTGNPELAEKHFEQALQTEPGFVWVKAELLPSLQRN